MSTQELNVDKDFATLIPPLTEYEYDRLEQSILAEGCRESIVVWNDTIIDGHNRYKICKAHNIAFQTIQQEFSSREEVILWMIQNQLGRRNLNDFQRVELVRKYEDTVKAQAEQRMLAGKSDPKVKLPEGQKNREQSRDKLGKLAGVSGSTYEHAVKVQKEAPPPVVEATRNGTISINTAYEVTKMPETQKTEIAERIEKGEAAKSVISEVKSRNRKQKTETATKTANEVSPQSATHETSIRNEEVNVKHEANTAAMNNEKQSQEVSSTIHPDAQTQQEETTRQLNQEANEHEIPQQTQPASEDSDNLTVHSDKETIQSSQFANNYEQDTLHAQYDEEEEVNSDDDDDRDMFEEEEESTRINIFKTDNSYSIIYADPIWEWYQSPEELLKLPVWRVANQNCALFLWVNSPRMPDAMKLIEKWGFTYRTIAFVWVKPTEAEDNISLFEDNNGLLGQTDNWTCENAEFCLLATKGTVQRVDDNIPQVFTCPMDENSCKPNYVKPEIFKQLTVQLLGNLPALELLPDMESLEQEDQFSTTYNKQYVEWDMAAPKFFLEQLAWDRRCEMIRESM